MGKLFPFRANEHIPHEKGMVSAGADDSNIDSISLIPAGKTIDDIDAISRIQIVNSPFAVDSPDLNEN